METTPTPFDLNQAIQQWRDGLAQSPAIQGENLEELETHLRDSVARLQAQALSAEEAFLIATKRVGSTAKLGAEFGKVNSPSAWLDRVFWAVVIMQTWVVLQSLSSACTAIISSAVFPSVIRGPLNWVNDANYFIAICIPTIFSALLALLIWRFTKFTKNRSRNLMNIISARPLALAMIFLIANLSAHFVSIASYNFINNYINGGRFHGGSYWFMYIQPLPGYLFFDGVIFILARKRLLRKA